MEEQYLIRQTLAEIKPELAQKFFVNQIGLFGSVTRADFSAQSDVDIVVDFTKPVGIEFIDLADFLEAKLKRKVDLVSINAFKPHYWAQIKPHIVYV